MYYCAAIIISTFVKINIELFSPDKDISLPTTIRPLDKASPLSATPDHHSVADCCSGGMGIKSCFLIISPLGK